MKDKKYKLGMGFLVLLLAVGFTNATTIKDNAVSIFTGGIQSEGNLDMQGNNITNFNEKIPRFAYDYTFTQKDNYIYVWDMYGKLAYGSDANLGVTDATEFANVLTTVINNANKTPSILIGSGDNWNELPYNYEGIYLINQSGNTINKAFTLRGMGKNRANINYAPPMAGKTIFILNGSGQTDKYKWIVRLADLKFGATDRSVVLDTLFKIDDINELMITNVEFRDMKTALNITNNYGYNYITNSWFVKSGIHINNTKDLIFSNNKITDNGILTFGSIETVSEIGNNYFFGGLLPVYTNITNYIGLQLNETTTPRIIYNSNSFQFGDGSTQHNITLTSPDGTEYTCGVADGGAFSCS